MRRTAMLAAAAGIAAAAALTAGHPAQASTGVTGPCAPAIGSHSASTTLTNRPDLGGANNPWATDGKVTPATPTAKLTRTLLITLVSHTGGTWTWDGTVCDGGTFATNPGQLAPNQGPGHTGETESSPSQAGTVNGLVTYQFSTDQPLNTGPNLGVLTSEDGAPAPGSDETTSLWYQQAFPVLTDFTGPGLVTFDYDYATGLFTVKKWHDATGTNGQSPVDGQIK